MSHIDRPGSDNAPLYQAASLSSGMALSEVATPTRAAGQPPRNRPYWAVKRAMDVLVAGSALLLLLPVFAVLWVAVRRDGGKAFFGHTRIGHLGRPFQCLKFRSMVPDAGDALARLLADDPAAARQWATTRKLSRDPRVTPLGTFLRASSLDEIPQLINVLRGEMSLVGPRPLIEPEAEALSEDWHSRRLDLRPGLTGPWQISGRSDTTVEEMVRFDYTYVAGWSLARDIEILFATVPAVLSGRGAY